MYFPSVLPPTHVVKKTFNTRYFSTNQKVSISFLLHKNKVL